MSKKAFPAEQPDVGAAGLVPPRPTDAAAAAVEYRPGDPGDEFHGQAGTFVFDPVTGRRTKLDDAAVVPAEQVEVTHG